MPMDDDPSRTSSDLTRPLWRQVVESVDTARTKLAVDDNLKGKQELLRSFYDDVMPRLKELGPVGQVAMSRLNVMMAEAGLFLGSVQPESVIQLMQAVQQVSACLFRPNPSPPPAPLHPRETRPPLRPLLL